MPRVKAIGRSTTPREGEKTSASVMAGSKPVKVVVHMPNGTKKKGHIATADKVMHSHVLHII